MQVSVLNAVLGLAVVAGWLAMAGYCWLAGRRRARQDADWASMAGNLGELDDELERLWAQETG